MPPTVTMIRKNDRMMDEFGKRLRKAREGKKYSTADDFAKDLKIKAPRYRKYERGQSMPPPVVLEAICELTEESLDFLILGRDKESRNIDGRSKSGNGR